MNVQVLGAHAVEDQVVRMRMAQQKAERLREALALLESCGAVLTNGHFRFGIGKDQKHGTTYVNPRKLFNKAFASKYLIQGLVDAIPSEIRQKVEIVAGPTTGGVIIARDLADFLSSGRKPGEPDVEALFFGRNPDESHALHESDKERLERGPRVLLVDDVRHRGVTFVSCHSLITSWGGEVIATAELIDRNETVLNLNVPNYFVGQIEHRTLYQPSECPMCKSNDPKVREITKL